VEVDMVIFAMTGIFSDKGAPSFVRWKPEMRMRFALRDAVAGLC
jgi:hypothetical protein